MRKQLLYIYSLRVLVLAVGFFYATDQVLATDPFNFCNNTCHAPGCDPNSQDPLVQRITKDCRSKCEGVYAQVAQHQMSKQFGPAGKTYRKASKAGKEAMWPQSPIGQCLGKETNALEASTPQTGLSKGVSFPPSILAEAPSGSVSGTSPGTPTASLPGPSRVGSIMVPGRQVSPSGSVSGTSPATATPSQSGPSSVASITVPGRQVSPSRGVSGRSPATATPSQSGPSSIGSTTIVGPPASTPSGGVSNKSSRSATVRSGGVSSKSSSSSTVHSKSVSSKSSSSSTMRSSVLSSAASGRKVKESTLIKMKADIAFEKARRDADIADKIKSDTQAAKMKADSDAAKARSIADAAKGKANATAASNAKKEADEAKRIADARVAKAKIDADLKDRQRAEAEAAKTKAESELAAAKRAEESARTREQEALAKAQEHAAAATKAKADLAKYKEEAERKEKEKASSPNKLSPAVVLSIDGAAVKGIAQADILIALEKEVNLRLQEYAKIHNEGYKYLKITDLFDYFAGTSAGSLNVGFLLIPQDSKSANASATPVEPKYTLQGLKQRIPEILKAAFSSPFKRRVRVMQVMGVALAGSKYSSKPIEAKFDEIAGDTRISDLVKPAIITSQDWTTYEPVIFSTVDTCSVDPNEEVFYQERDRDGYQWKDSNVTVKDAIRASMAAQSFFKPKVIKLDGKQRVLVDGGNVAQNPAWVAHVYAQEYFKDRPLTIISISGGQHVTKDGKVLSHKVKAKGKTAGKILSIIEPTISGGMQGQQLLTDQMMEKIPNLTYHRLHFDITNNKFDDTSEKNQTALHEAARKTINSAEFKQAVKSIADAFIERKVKKDLKPFICAAKKSQQGKLSTAKDRQIGITASLLHQKEKILESCRALARKKLKSLADRKLFHKQECKKQLAQVEESNERLFCRSLGKSESDRTKYQKKKCATILAKSS